MAKKRPERLPIICESRKSLGARPLSPAKLYSFAIGAGPIQLGTNLSNAYFSLGLPAGCANSFPKEPPGMNLETRLIPGNSAVLVGTSFSGLPFGLSPSSPRTESCATSALDRITCLADGQNAAQSATTITASYSGDANIQASSAALNQAVNAAFGLTGCGGGGSRPAAPKTAPGSYNFTVAANSGSVQTQSSYTLVVQRLD
jgi:hypothetical protein